MPEQSVIVGISDLAAAARMLDLETPPTPRYARLSGRAFPSTRKVSASKDRPARPDRKERREKQVPQGHKALARAALGFARRRCIGPSARWLRIAQSDAVRLVAGIGARYRPQRLGTRSYWSPGGVPLRVSGADRSRHCARVPVFAGARLQGCGHTDFPSPGNENALEIIHRDHAAFAPYQSGWTGASTSGNPHLTEDKLAYR
jgi:hypothetical protein